MQLTPELIGMKSISPSKLDCYEQCPRLFYYQNWLGIQLDEDKLHLDFGTAIHAAIEMIYLEYDYNFGGAWVVGDFEKVKERFLRHWTPKHVTETSFQNFLETKAGKESGFTSKEQLYEAFKEDGIAMLQSYWYNKERMLVEYDHDLVDFEKMLKVRMVNPEDPEDSLPIPLSMRMDAKNRSNTKIVDFKTSKSKYDEAETRKKIQGQCYLFGELMETGNLITKFDYIVLRKSMKSADRIEVVQLQYDMADMLAFYHRVKAILTRIANREFDRPVAGHASYCQCYKYEDILSVKDINLIK